MYLFLSVLGLCCFLRAFSSCSKWGPPSRGAQATHCGGFSCGSAGKESACNVGDLGSTPELEDPLEKGKATHSSILAWGIP